MLFLVPIVAAGAAYLTRDESGSYDAGDGSRKIDCYQIWDQITHGPGPGSIENGQRAATRLKGSYEDRVTTIDKLAKDMDAAWTGKGAAAAQDAGAHPMKAWMTDSGTKLADSDKYLGNQHNAFTTVAAKVQEVPKEPPGNGFLNSITPWETDTDRAIEDYNRNGQANVDAFNEYFKASSENGSGLPTYSALDGDLAKIGVTEEDPNGKDKNGNGKDGTGRDSGTSDPGGSGYTPGNLPGGGGNYQPGNLPGGGGYKPGDLPGPGGPGSGGGYQPPNIPGGGNYQPGNIPGGGGYQPGNIPGYDGTKAAGYTPPNIPGPGSDYGSGSGFGPGGAGNLPGGGYGGGAGGGFGPGGAGNLGGGSSSGAGGASGSGAGAGMGRGGAGAAAAGGAGMGKAGGMGGMGMGGMGGARGGQGGGGDEEHTSKYLMGDDPNDLFGTDELTAPPVIGE